MANPEHCTVSLGVKCHRAGIAAITCFFLAACSLAGHAQAGPGSTAPLSDATQTTTIAEASLPSLEDLGLPPASTQVKAAGQAAPENPNSTSTNPQKDQTAPATDNGLSLQGLGFTPSQSQPNAQLQARLDKRTRMLKIHQKLGLITVIPMFATVVAGGGAKAKFSHGPGSPIINEPTNVNVDVHAALGSLTATMYGATAYYAIFAPKIPGTKPVGNIRLHRDLAFIHGPGMVLTPILGGMALSQQEKGQKPHGIAAAHSYVAWTTVIAYSAAIVSVSWPIKWKFWEHS
ncbi:MAG: hypothetical protein ACYDC6_04940 [Acidobacteriaceae bacterium]